MFNLDDPKTVALLMAGAGLLGGAPGQRKNFGADLSHGLLSGLTAYQGAQQNKRLSERDQRESKSTEMQQLLGTYKFLKEQDQQNLAESQLSGRPYQPHPGIAQIESKLMGLMPGADSAPRGLLFPSPQTGLMGNPGNTPAGIGATSGPMGMETSSGHVIDSGGGTEVNPPPARFPQPQQAPSSNAPQGMPQPAAQQPQQQAPTLQQLIKAANIPEAVAVGLIRANRIGDLHKLIAEALRLHNGPGGISSIDPATGAVRILGGNASPGTVPWSLKDGIPTAMPIQGAAEEVARAEGMKAGAVERARAPFNFSSHPVGPGGAPQVMSTQELMRREQGAGSRNPIPQGYNGRSPDADARAILAQELQANPNDPALRREIELRFPDLLQQRAPSGSNGLTGPNPLEVKATEALNDDFVKNGYRPIMDAAKSADSILARVGAMQRNKMLDKTGWGAAQKAYAANLIGAFGVKDAQAFAGDAQMFQKFIFDANWELLNQAKGPQTEQDAQRALKTFAQLENTPNANRFILDFTAATAKLVKQKAAFVDRETRARRGDLQGIEQAWHEQNRSVWDMPEMMKWSGDGKAAGLSSKQVQLPGGRVATFPSETAANAYRKQMGLQ